MKPKAPKGPPAQVAVVTPYGHPPLVEATEAMVKQHVTSNVTAVVQMLDSAYPGTGWDRFLQHSGWVDPAGRIGLMDFSYNFPKPDSLEGMTLTLLVVAIEGGNGEPLHRGTPVARCHMTFEKGGWGELCVTNSKAETSAWNEWMEAARDKFKHDWVTALKAGDLIGLSNPLAREATMKKLLQGFWKAERLQALADNRAIDVVLLDDEDEAEQHCSSLEFQATDVMLVSAELAEQLQKRGAIAGVVRGLPLWSRDNKDAMHLERVMQDIAYDKFGHSQQTNLAGNQE